MKYRELGSTGEMIPEIGLGTWKYQGGSEPLRKGIELGAYLIDTAEMYKTENAVGVAIKDHRDKVFLATKVLGSNLRYDEVLKAAEKSLRLLEQDVIDLYQIHWSNRSVPISETMGAMEELVERGMIRYIGVSNFSVEDMREAQHVMSKNPLVSNQVLYNLKRREIERDLIPYCVDNNITVIAYTPLADGSLSAKSNYRSDKGAKVLKQIAQDIGKTQAQVALNWCLSQANLVVIPKSNSVRRTIENCAASGWYLNSRQVTALNEVYPC